MHKCGTDCLIDAISIMLKKHIDLSSTWFTNGFCRSVLTRRSEHGSRMSTSIKYVVMIVCGEAVDYKLVKLETSRTVLLLQQWVFSGQCLGVKHVNVLMYVCGSLPLGFIIYYYLVFYSRTKKKSLLVLLPFPSFHLFCCVKSLFFNRITSSVAGHPTSGSWGCHTDSSAI